jgi:carboxyl-terminal processing protease
MIQKDASKSINRANISSTRRKKFIIPSSAWLVLIAIAVVTGYVSGIYHYQIEAAIGPVFGYNAHSGSIDLSSLQQTYNKLAANYDGKLNITALIQGANSGLVAAAGDDYTIYMTPKEATDYQDGLSGNIGGGIGAEIGIKNNQITILRVLDDNSAKAAGLTANDIVLAVNDQLTSGWTVDKAISLIRGEEDTTVKLTIQRGTAVQNYTITRAIINNPSVTSSIVDNVGTMTITRFDEKTGDLAHNIAQNFKKQGVKAIIVDLRDNGGGYVNAAKDVVGLWLNNQVVVTERTTGAIRSTLSTSNDAILDSIPTVILINSNTASASEIVAGALHDHGAAKLVGEKTYGKGSVQELLALDGGAQLKVTVARWYTPNGINITKEGIKPDVKAPLTQSDLNNSVDPQLDAAKKLLGL